MEDKLNFIKTLKTSENTEGVQNNLIRIIKGSILAIIISIILLTIYAALLTYTSIAETTMTIVVITIAGISILIGSSISARKIKKQGMLNGALVGIVYMLALYLISSSTSTGFNMDVKTIIMILVGAIAGMIGGIIGVNVP